MRTSHLDISWAPPGCHVSATGVTLTEAWMKRQISEFDPCRSSGVTNSQRLLFTSPPNHVSPSSEMWSSSSSKQRIRGKGEDESWGEIKHDRVIQEETHKKAFHSEVWFKQESDCNSHGFFCVSPRSLISILVFSVCYYTQKHMAVLDNVTTLQIYVNLDSVSVKSC